MKIKNIANVKQFFKKINDCNGSVEILTSQGDRLNLKSTLCQYIAITQMFDDENQMEYELLLSDNSDYEIIKQFIVE